MTHSFPSNVAWLRSFCRFAVTDYNRVILDVRNDPHLPTTLNATKSNLQSSPTDMLFCTNDMCPIKVHWHIKLNYQEYWRVKITITNRDITRNYTLWNLVAQHPNFQNFTEAFSFSYRPLNPYGPTATSKWPVSDRLIRSLSARFIHHHVVICVLGRTLHVLHHDIVT